MGECECGFVVGIALNIIECDNLTQVFQFLLHTTSDGILLFVAYKNDFRLGIVDDVFNLVSRAGRVDGYRNSTVGIGCEVGNKNFRTVS